jgi:cell wall assembly regulator SMI1
MSVANSLIEALELHGFRPPAIVSPPTTDAEFAEAEHEFGFELPKQLRDLYAYSSHPFDRWVSKGNSLLHGVLKTQYEFLPWSAVRPKWRFGRELEASHPAINTDDVLPEDKVRRKADDAGRIPVARGISSCYIYVDCRPGPSGTVGQVIETTQEAMVNWMGGSLSECFSQFIRLLDSGFIRVAEEGGGEYFDWVDASGESVLYDWWSVTGQRSGGYQGDDFV